MKDEKLIEKRKKDVNKQDKYGHTDLMWFCYHNNIEMVKELLKYPQIDINIKSTKGMSAYDWAEENNNKEIMLLLKIHKLKQAIYSNEKL